jgi:hypothetical protein
VEIEKGSNLGLAGWWWLAPVILATQEAEIRRILVQNKPRLIVQETPSQKKTITKRAYGMVQGVGPEFKPQYCQKKFKNWPNHFLYSLAKLTEQRPGFSFLKYSGGFFLSCCAGPIR